MVGLQLAAFLLTAPPPAAPAAPPRLGETAAAAFAGPVANLLVQVRAEYYRPVGLDTLALSVARELYRTAGEKCPAGVEASARSATTIQAASSFLIRVRLDLGDRAVLRTPFDGLAAWKGVSAALDPYSEPILDAAGGSIGHSGVESTLGVEFKGLGNDWWVAQFVARRAAPADFSPVVGRVSPGGFAARNGIRPGDVLRSIAGIPVEPGRFDELTLFLRTLYSTYASALTREEFVAPPKFEVVYDRAGTTRRADFRLDRDPDRVESVVGVRRNDKGEWAYLLPESPGRPRLGFVRLGTLDYGAGHQFADALAGLEKEKAEGLILDLRGCPGGYVSEAGAVAERLLPNGKVIYAGKTTSSGSFKDALVKSVTSDNHSFSRTVPLLVLVDGTTTGGGEMIAAALQDNGRAKVAGRRTFGKGVIMTTLPTHLSGVSFRLCSGVSLRPDGTDRHRYPGAKPQDPWGVKPDPGWEIPTSRDFEGRVRDWYDLQAIRPWKSTEALPLDDPQNDPALLLATRMLAEHVRGHAGRPDARPKN